MGHPSRGGVRIAARRHWGISPSSIFSPINRAGETPGQLCYDAGATPFETEHPTTYVSVTGNRGAFLLHREEVRA